MEKQLTEQESLHLITSMIQKAKANYHEKGTGAIMWGIVVAIASFVKFAQVEFDFKLPFDIFLIVLFAIIPQVYLSVREGKLNKVKQYDDAAIDVVWLVYGISIFGLVFYNNVISKATSELMLKDGYTLFKHYTDTTKPADVWKPYAPSSYSLYILLYAFPTLVTGMIKKFKPMIFGAIITYILFGISCYTMSKYDMLLGSFAAIICWLIPGIILRRKYSAQLRNANV